MLLAWSISGEEAEPIAPLTYSTLGQDFPSGCVWTADQQVSQNRNRVRAALISISSHPPPSFVLGCNSHMRTMKSTRLSR